MSAAKYTLADLRHDQTVRARWGRAGREAPMWGQWQDIKLHVQRVVGTKGRTKGSYGPLASLAIKRVDGTPINWAEYGEQDFDPHHKTFECEGYYLEIEGLQ